MNPKGIVLCCTASLVSACGAFAGDSAGYANLPTFAVSTAPTLVLADDGTSEKQFTRISARRLPSGEIVVADQGSVAIHVFGRDGRHVSTLASRGPGPDELPGGFVLATHEDTVFAFGQQPMSPPDVHVFAAGSGHVTTYRPRTETGTALTTRDRLSTGELFVQRGQAFTVIASMPAEGELRPDSVTFGIYRQAPTDRAAAGIPEATVTWLPAVVRHAFVGFDWPSGPVPRTMTPLTLGERTFVLVSADRVWSVNTATGALRAYDGSGNEVVSTTMGLEPEPFDAAALDAHRAQLLAKAERSMDSLRALAATNPDILPATMPLIDAAFAGADGELWLRLLDLDGRNPQRFVIVDRSGKPAARTTVGRGLDIQHIGRDFILAIERDSLGVESVTEYALDREPPASD